MFRKKTEFIKNAGACLVSKNILNGHGQLKWLVREKSINPKVDNGWRIFSDIDTSEYLDNPNNLSVCDFNTVAEIEPAIIAIYLLPVGSDLQLVKEDGKITFYDNLTEQQLKLS